MDTQVRRVSHSPDGVQGVAAAEPFQGLLLGMGTQVSSQEQYTLNMRLGMVTQVRNNIHATGSGRHSPSTQSFLPEDLDLPRFEPETGG